ncbi:MAG: endolytic transglycosylase MltG [Desulfovibrio sp.]|nr:endolytic transglycosylase MltG [Desulfovibrio sp.]
MRYFPRLLVAVLILLLLCGAGLGIMTYHFLTTPPSQNGNEVFFDIPPGARLSGVATRLKENGVITDARFFTLLARWKNEQNAMKAGRFALRTDWLPEKVLQTIVHGQPVLYRLTIPEGLTYWQTGRLLEEAGFLTFPEFMEIITDKNFLRHYGIPFDSAEGFLMPDTYLLKKPGSLNKENNNKNPQCEDKNVQGEARKLIGRLVDNFWRKTSPLWPDGKRPDAKALARIVTLASIVEKETSVPAERPRVAGVYTNRLNRNMLLQADPTVIYGIGPKFSGKLLHRHLDNLQNLYNTYQHLGLPPGPICSFGISALSAAICPEQHDFLYFVAKTDGGEHIFSRTLEEHNRAVRNYRNNSKKQ